MSVRKNTEQANDWFNKQKTLRTTLMGNVCQKEREEVADRKEKKVGGD